MTSVLLENWRMNETLCDYPAGRIYPDNYRPATTSCRPRDGWTCRPRNPAG